MVRRTRRKGFHECCPLTVAASASASAFDRFYSSSVSDPLTWTVLLVHSPYTGCGIGPFLRNVQEIPGEDPSGRTV